MWEIAIIEIELRSENYRTDTIMIYKYFNYCCYKVEKEITTNYTTNDRITTIAYKFTNLDSNSLRKAITNSF